MQDAISAPASPGQTAASAEPHPSLERDAGRLHRCLRELIRVVQFRDRDRICCHDVSVSQCYALETVVRDGPLTVNGLAAGMYLDKSTASRLVDGLAGKGYVCRERHPEDGRAILVEASDEGRRLLHRIESELIEESRRVLADLDPELRATVVPLLERLVRTAAERIESSSSAGDAR